MGPILDFARDGQEGRRSEEARGKNPRRKATNNGIRYAFVSSVLTRSHVAASLVSSCALEFPKRDASGTFDEGVATTRTLAAIGRSLQAFL